MKLNILYNNNMILLENQELKNKNIELEARIVCVELELDELRTENQELRKENQELRKENQELKIENQELKNKIKELYERIAILEFDKIKLKIITALQDINSYDNLEVKLNIKTSLIRLRKNRNGINHYIDIDDNNDIINYKKIYLLTQLNNLSIEQKDIINKRYGNYDLINEIILYLNDNINQNYDISNDEIEDVDLWWLD
jgi:FtsZ-binding cell division protein ZapB